MKITIKETKSGRCVYNGRNKIGIVRKFCCGIDFRLINKPNCLFSILEIKNYDDKLIMCIQKIMSLNIPDKSFHWNFSYDIAKDEKKIKSYQLALDKLI